MKFLNFLLIAVSYFAYLVYKPYILDIAIASLMAIAFGKIDVILYKKLKNKYAVSFVSTVILALLIFGPMIYFLIEGGKFIAHIKADDINFLLVKARELIANLPDVISTKIEPFITQNNVHKIYAKIMPLLGTVTAKSAVFIKDAFLIVVFFFFATLYGKEILLFLRKIIPLEESKLEKLFKVTSEIMSLVFYSAIMTALLEGVLFGFIVSLFGLNFFFFTILYAFSSLIPVVGGIIMWAPVSLYLYATGNTEGAIIVALYSIIVISVIVDTFVKPLIIEWVKHVFGGDTELNSLLIFFAILAGLSSFGLWGIIIGPAVTALFISILKFYQKVN
jgi:predicted PurR-regulated permease PerM